MAAELLFLSTDVTGAIPHALRAIAHRRAHPKLNQILLYLLMLNHVPLDARSCKDI
jgi:hypothetical protein